jgi:large subunit ribosomal protein L4
MIELPVYNKQGKQVDTLSIDEGTLGGEVRPALLKQAYVRFHGNQRQGSARTKSKGMVEGSTRKLFKQKGTGGARRGQVRTNVMKGGGVAFAKTRGREAFRADMPKKMRRLANRNALLAKLVDSEVKCIDNLSFTAPKTSTFVAMLATLGIDRTCLVAIDGGNVNALRSARNIEGVRTTRIEQLNAFDLLNHRYLVVDKASLEAFLSGAATAGDAGDDKETA